MEVEPLGTGMRVALMVGALGTFVLGVFPSSVLEFAGRSAALVR
jgi:hypothetical protein